MVRSLLIFVCLATAGYGQVNPPRVGIAHFEDGSVRDIDGLAASYVVGPVRATGVEAASFSSAGAILAFSNKLQIWSPGGTIAADEPLPESIEAVGAAPAGFAAWCPRLNSILYSHGEGFARITLASSPAGRVVAITMRDGDSAVLLISDSQGALTASAVSLLTGAILSERFLPGVGATAAFLNDSLVFPDDRGLIVRGDNGGERIAPLTARDLTFERMSDNWLHVASLSTHQHWALQVTAKSIHLSELPAPATQGARP